MKLSSIEAKGAFCSNDNDWRISEVYYYGLPAGI